jgi:hypothetical protein
VYTEADKLEIPQAQVCGVNMRFTTLLPLPQLIHPHSCTCTRLHYCLQTTVNSSGDIECSIEETNRIRIALGLKPLDVSNNKEEEEKKRKAREEAEKQRQQLEVQSRILR